MRSRVPTPQACFVLGLAALCASSGSARDNSPTRGSAIAPVFSIRHDAMRPGEPVVLTLCVRNDNPASKRSLEPGDEFSWTFGAGALGACEELTSFSPSAALDASLFRCDRDGNRVALVWEGEITPWPPGEAICLELPHLAGFVSSTVLVETDVGTVGAYSSPHPNFLPLTVSEDIGSVGPPGPGGPAGPPGPEGPPGLPVAGAVVSAQSTVQTSVGACEDAAIIPGLDRTIELDAGSRLLILLDAASEADCFGGRQDHPGRLNVWLDSRIVASRVLKAIVTEYGGDHWHGSYLSTALAAGPHRVRVEMAFEKRGVTDCRERTVCVGHGTHPHQSRLTLIELRP